MHRYSTAILALSALAVTACQPQKTPEQLAAEQAAAAFGQMAGALGQLGGVDGAAGQMSPEQLAAAMAQAGAMASAMNPDMTAEDRAKLNAITGAMASGQVNPAASAYVTGMGKAIDLLSTVKDTAGVAAIRPQVAAVYAEMNGPAAALRAMPEDQREIAFGTAMGQMMTLGLRAASLMGMSSAPADVQKAVGDMLDEMPKPE